MRTFRQLALPLDMAELTSPPIDPSVTGVTPVAGADGATAEDENLSETLYIQNLNEKIKIPG